MAAILLISLALSVGPLSRQFPDKYNSLLMRKRLFGLWGFVFSFIHSMVSSLLLAGIFNSYYINFIYSCFDNYYLPNFI